MIEELIRRLEHIALRKTMYIYPLNVRSLQNFLTGFRCAVTIEGISFSNEIVRRIAAQRGWNWSPFGAVPHMKRKRMTSDQIMDELIAIEIDILREAQQNNVEPPAA